MRITVNPITVDTDSGPVVCTEAEVSVAVSSSVAMRLVPVDSSANLYPDQAQGIVGTGDDADIATFLATVAEASRVLAVGRGI
jgi:hypothetical protein